MIILTYEEIKSWHAQFVTRIQFFMMLTVYVDNLYVPDIILRFMKNTPTKERNESNEALIEVEFLFRCALLVSHKN